MTDCVKITLPLPPRELSPNGAHGHWSKVSRARKAYRRYAWAETIRAFPVRCKAFPKAEAQAVFYWPDKRRRDIRNAEHMLKPAYDGIVDAGLIPDDCADVLTHLPTRFELDKDNPRVEITIRSA